MTKKLSKYIAAFDHIDKTLIALSATSGGISIISFTSVIGIPAGLASASFTFIFSLTTGIVKKLLKVTREKKKKHNKIVRLAKSKLNSIENLMSQALIDLDRIDASFSKLAIKVDEQGHNDRDIDYEIERQKAIENELGCKFIKINPAKKDFNIFVEIGRIQNYIAKSTKKLTEESTTKIFNRRTFKQIIKIRIQTK